MKTHSLKTLLPLILIILGINACSDGSGGTGSIGDKQPPVSPTPVSPKPVEPTDPGLVDLDDFNGIYFNPETKQIALIDVDEQYQVMLQNYYDIDDVSDKPPHLHLVEGLEAGETEATSGATTTWTFDNNKFETSGQTLSLSDDGNTLTVTNNDSSIVSNPDGNDPVLTKQDPSRPLSELTMNLRTDINGTTWTIEESGYFKMNLRGKCVFTGTLEDSGKGYYVTENATLGTGCEDVGYAADSYTTKFYSFDSTFDDGSPATYVATVSIHNDLGASQRPIFSVIAVTLRKEPIDGVYYANRKEFMGVSGVTCDEPAYCLDDGDNTNDQNNAAIDGTYGQIVFIDYKKKPYNVVIHKALAGAPNLVDQPFADVIFMKAEYAKDAALGEEDKNTLIASEYYIGPTMGLINDSGPVPAEPRSGDVIIKLNKSDAGSYVKVTIANAELFDPNETTNSTFGAKIPDDGVEFSYQAPTPISELLLPDVLDRSGVVWRLNSPMLDGSGIEFWAKSASLGDPCLDGTPNVVSGKLTNEKDYYFSDDATIFSKLIADLISVDASDGMTTNLYGVIINGEVYLSTNVVPNDATKLPMAMAGGLSPKWDTCP